MKKHTSMILSMTALLTLTASAPQVFWQAHKDMMRAPANIEKQEDADAKMVKSVFKKPVLEEAEPSYMEMLIGQLEPDAPLKDLEKADLSSRHVANVEVQEELKPLEEVKLESRSVVEAKEEKLKDLEEQILPSSKVTLVEVKLEKAVDQVVSCLKDKKASNLEAEIKKLMEDKEAIVKEIADLKPKTKKKSEVSEMIKSSDNSADVLGIMSQLTSLMISQQQQQMMMMQQMFSLMSQPKMDNGLLNGYNNPYAFNTNSFYTPGASMAGNNVGIPYQSHQMYSMNNMNTGMYHHQEMGAMNYDRTPSATSTMNPIFADMNNNMSSASSLSPVYPAIFDKPQFATPDLLRVNF